MLFSFGLFSCWPNTLLSYNFILNSNWLFFFWALSVINYYCWVRCSYFFIFIQISKWETYIMYEYSRYLLEHLICIISNATPSNKHKLPTTIYAMPRKGFFPPKREVVLKIIFFFPWKLDTENARNTTFQYHLVFLTC